LRILQNIIVPEADHAVTLRFQKGGSLRIACGRMLAAISFNDQLCLGAEEICNVTANRRLLDLPHNAQTH
jgi:hypothetical protein